MSFYSNSIAAWERRLNRVDQDRRVRAFDWGTEWLQALPLPPAPLCAPRAAPGEVMPAWSAWTQRVVDRSPEFFDYPRVGDYRLQADAVGGPDWLRFTSPVTTPHAENNTVSARWFPAPAAAGRKRAVVVLAQWNSDAGGHLGLCRILQRAGIACLRVSKPYHDARRPAHLVRAEYTVDTNLGRTVHAARQAVCDIRASLDWLQQQGYDSLGIAGTSLGSCYALLTSAHDPRLRVNVFNHVSNYFGDVVWTGLATMHVRRGIETHLDQAQLREAWRAISPASYMEQYRRMSLTAAKKNLLIWARYDPCFLPDFSRQVVANFARLGLHHEALALPCGHYTIGRVPFKFWDAWAITRFLRRWL